MILQLIARHIRDDQDQVLEETGSYNVEYLVGRMREEILSNKAEGSNWRFSIVAHEDEYKI